MSAKVPTRTRLTITERENMERMVDEHESDQKETGQFFVPDNAKRGDDEQTKRIRKVLNEDASKDSYSEHENIEMEQEWNSLREWLKSKMVSAKGMSQRPNTSGVQNAEFRRAVNACIRDEMGNSEFQERAKRYKFLSYALKRPEEADIELLRPE